MSTDWSLTLSRDYCVAFHIHLSSQCSGFLISDREPQSCWEGPTKGGGPFVYCKKPAILLILWCSGGIARVFGMHLPHLLMEEKSGGKMAQLVKCHHGRVKT